MNLGYPRFHQSCCFATVHGHTPHLLAVLNNMALGLLARQGVTNGAQ